MDNRTKAKLRFAFEETTTRFSTVADIVVNTLQGALLNGVFEEGETLLQSELMVVLGVGRVPIREALRQLAASGLVEFHPRGTAIVSWFSSEDVSDICEMRRMAEVQALRQSLCSKAGPALKRAEEILDRLDAEQDILKYGILNRDFHNALYEGATSKRLRDLIDALHLSGDRYMRFCPDHLEYMKKSQDEHHMLLFACHTMNIPDATQLLDQHIHEGSLVIIHFLNDRRSVSQTDNAAQNDSDDRENAETPF